MPRALRPPASRNDAQDPELKINFETALVLIETENLNQAWPLSDTAARIYENLARKEPSRFEPTFASSLNNLASLCAMLGHPDEALRFLQRAVEIREELAQTAPDLYESALGQSLYNLGNVLSDLGRPQNALSANERAVEIYRRIAPRSPDRHEPDLAGALYSLTLRYSNAGRADDALLVAQEATEVLRRLHTQLPGRYRRRLGDSLRGFAALHEENGKQDIAAALRHEAEELFVARGSTNTHDVAPAGEPRRIAGSPLPFEVQLLTVQGDDSKDAATPGSVSDEVYLLPRRLFVSGIVDSELRAVLLAVLDRISRAQVAGVPQDLGGPDAASAASTEN
ncbi:tetratricopeptide repeat protein [Promicromonospora thailandica]|nr:tetratricopeptide repeat protein [Promicromonospora thailandica]BFF18701.1 hypothetical protein GCM10025730_22220 [Promicromonospora thailandica]